MDLLCALFVSSFTDLKLFEGLIKSGFRTFVHRESMYTEFAAFLRNVDCSIDAFTSEGIVSGGSEDYLFDPDSNSSMAWDSLVDQDSSRDNTYVMEHTDH